MLETGRLRGDEVESTSQHFNFEASKLEGISRNLNVETSELEDV